MRHVLFVVLVLGLVPFKADAADLTLRITLQVPLKNHLGQNLLLFKQEVENNAKGEIAVEIYDSAQLYRDKEVPQAVSTGQIEMGVAPLTRYAGEVAAVDIFDQPFLLNTEDKVRAATTPDSPVRAPLDQAILETGSRVLWWQPFGTAIMLSKGHPLKTPADIKGKKVRVFGKTAGAFIKAVGGIPTLTSGSEQFLAYQRGTVDVGTTGVAAIKSRSLWEVMDTVTVTNHSDLEFVVVINADLWAGLPQYQQDIISAAALKAEGAIRDEIAAIEAEAYQDAAEHGMTIYHLNPSEIEAWRQGAAPVLEEFKASAGPLGAEVLQAAQSLQ